MSHSNSKTSLVLDDDIQTRLFKLLIEYNQVSKVTMGYINWLFLRDKRVELEKRNYILEQDVSVFPHRRPKLRYKRIEIVDADMGTDRVYLRELKKQVPKGQYREGARISALPLSCYELTWTLYRL